jgi:hypothetical protein
MFEVLLPFAAFGFVACLVWLFFSVSDKKPSDKKHPIETVNTPRLETAGSAEPMSTVQREDHDELTGNANVQAKGTQPANQGFDGAFKLVAAAVGVILLVAWCAGRGGIGAVANPRSLFQETRAGVTREDVRQTLREMEDNVPDTLREMQANVPDVMRDMERQMMKDAHKYGLSHSEVRSQIRDIERQTRSNIWDMEDDVRQNIRDLEEPVWEQLRRIERGY